MSALKNAIDEITLSAQHIKITCPLGTHFEGTPGKSVTEGGEVTVSRYPMGVPKPVLADGFTGVVRLTHYLTPAGSKVYTPAYLELPGIVTAHVEGSRIENVTGEVDLVEAFREHYQRVAREFGLEPFNICLLYTSPSPRDKRQSRMPSSA